MTSRVGDAGQVLRPDLLVVEEPMEIRLDDHPVTTTMRTPGNDYELAVGFCFTEGVLDGAPVKTVRYCSTDTTEATASAGITYNLVTVSTAGQAPVPEARLRSTTSSCGLCGAASLDALQRRLAPLPAPTPPINLTALARAADEARRHQPLFDQTGSIHAAAVFEPATGDVELVREDIGRHNAVDKVIGRLLLDDRLPATGLGLLVSGRASFEIVQKAWAAGFGLLAAVSGPSALAVETARAANLALVGFLRGTTANVYAPDPGLSLRQPG
jgi:FdhD protein